MIDIDLIVKDNKVFLRILIADRILDYYLLDLEAFKAWYPDLDNRLRIDKQKGRTIYTKLGYMLIKELIPCKFASMRKDDIIKFINKGKYEDINKNMEMLINDKNRTNKRFAVKSKR